VLFVSTHGEIRFCGGMDKPCNDMCPIGSVSFSIRVNGQFSEPSRGIRQRDPIDPYMVLLCGEDL
jgi:hypothetical protein